MVPSSSSSSGWLNSSSPCISKAITVRHHRWSVLCGEPSGRRRTLVSEKAFSRLPAMTSLPLLCLPSLARPESLGLYLKTFLPRRCHVLFISQVGPLTDSRVKVGSFMHMETETMVIELVAVFYVVMECLVVYVILIVERR